jgi:hypothetical protein
LELNKLVDQAVNELKDRVSIIAIIFNCDDQYDGITDKSYPQKRIEDLPG